MKYKFGAVIASGPLIQGHADCRLMISAIDAALRTANPSETKRLAEWRNDLERTRRKAIHERWTGWEEEFLP